MKKDIIFECGFYGRKPKQMGCMYFCPVLELQTQMELLFTALFVAKILTHRKLSLRVATQLKEKLADSQSLQKIVAQGRCECGHTDCIEIVDYKSTWQMVISSSMILKDKPVFRWGQMGCGFLFVNKRKLEFCAEQSIYGLLDTMECLHAGDELFIDALYKTVAGVASLPFGEALNNKNYYDAAYKVVMEKERR